MLGSSASDKKPSVHNPKDTSEPVVSSGKPVRRSYRFYIHGAIVLACLSTATLMVHLYFGGREPAGPFMVASMAMFALTAASLFMALKDVEHLERNDARFRDYISASSDWYWEMDENLRFTYLSRRMEDVLDMKVEEFLGKTRADFHVGHVDLLDENWKNHLSLIERHESYRDFEYEYVRKDGKKLTIRNSGRAIFSKDGRFVGYRGVSSDITEATRARNEKLELEARLHAAIEALDEGVVFFDDMDRLIMFNRRYREMNALIADKLVPGAHFRELLEALVASGELADAEGRTEDFIEERMRQFRNPSGPLIQRRSDGKWVQLTDTRLENGWLVGTRVDVTEFINQQETLRMMEERLEEAIGSIPDGFALFDAEDRLVLANDTFRRFFPGMEGTLNPGVRYQWIVREGVRRNLWINRSRTDEELVEQIFSLHRKPLVPGNISWATGDGSCIPSVKHLVATSFLS